MATTVLHVEGMSCEHCVKAVTKAVTALGGVSGVQVDLQGKTVTVEHDPAGTTLAQMKEAIEDQGYDVVA
jgi:copper chaperone